MSSPHTPGTPAEAEQRFRTLYADVHADVLRFVRRRLPLEALGEADDVVADTLLVAWRRFDDAPRRLDAQRAWVSGIARNCLLTTHRGSNRRQAPTVRLAEGIAQEASGLFDGLIAELDLAAAWRHLPPGDQEVLALTIFDELTSSQAAVVLGTSPTAYRLRLMRARRARRTHLTDVDASEPAPVPRHPAPFTDDALEATR